VLPSQLTHALLSQLTHVLHSQALQQNEGHPGNPSGKKPGASRSLMQALEEADHRPPTYTRQQLQNSSAAATDPSLAVMSSTAPTSSAAAGQAAAVETRAAAEAGSITVPREGSVSAAQDSSMPQHMPGQSIPSVKESLSVEGGPSQQSEVIALQRQNVGPTEFGAGCHKTGRGQHFLPSLLEEELGEDERFVVHPPRLALPHPVRLPWQQQQRQEQQQQQEQQITGRAEPSDLCAITRSSSSSSSSSMWGAQSCEHSNGTDQQQQCVSSSSSGGSSSSNSEGQACSVPSHLHTGKAGQYHYI